MDVNHPTAPHIETTDSNRIHMPSTKSKSYLKVSRLLISISMFMLGLSCSRSPYQGSAAYDCEGGDRVILNERLFCVFTELRYTRETPSDMGADNLDSSFQATEQSDMFQGDLPETVDLQYCPETLPIAYRYETLTLCSEGEISNDLLEAIVATWNELYNETADESDDPVIDMSVQDDPVASDGGIGVIIDEEPSEPEESNVVIDMSVSEE